MLYYLQEGGIVENLIRPVIILALFGVLGFGLYWVAEYRNKAKNLDSVVASLVECNSEMKDSLLAGLIARFNYETDGEKPLDFERFVARIIRMQFGGKTSVTRPNSDMGVDIEHQREEGLYLGQVKCYALENKVGFEPVAIIHSQMVRQGALGGFVVTTSDYTSAAKKYADEIGIELVNGKELINLWTQTIRRQKKTVPKLPEKKEA